MDVCCTPKPTKEQNLPDPTRTYQVHPISLWRAQRSGASPLSLQRKVEKVCMHASWICCWYFSSEHLACSVRPRLCFQTSCAFRSLAIQVWFNVLWIFEMLPADHTGNHRRPLAGCASILGVHSQEDSTPETCVKRFERNSSCICHDF